MDLERGGDVLIAVGDCLVPVMLDQRPSIRPKRYPGGIGADGPGSGEARTRGRSRRYRDRYRHRDRKRSRAGGSNLGTVWVVEGNGAMVSVPSGVGPGGGGEDEMMPRGKLSVCRVGGFGWTSSLGGGREGWNLQSREGFGLAHAKTQRRQGRKDEGWMPFRGRLGVFAS
jgi:hypothetical protein